VKILIVSLILLIAMTPIAAFAYAGGGGIFYISSRTGSDQNIAQHSRFSDGDSYDFNCVDNGDSVVIRDDTIVREFSQCLRDAVVRGYTIYFNHKVRLGFVDVYSLKGKNAQNLVDIEADKLIRVSANGQSSSLQKVITPESISLVIYLELDKEYSWYLREGNTWIEFYPDFSYSNGQNRVYGVTIEEPTYIALIEK